MTADPTLLDIHFPITDWFFCFVFFLTLIFGPYGGFVSIVSFWSFRWFYLFQLFRFGRFVSLFRVLVHARFR